MTSDSDNLKQRLSAIVRELGVAEETPPSEPISRTRVLQLMDSDDIEVLGMLYKFVTDKKRSKVISPSLQFEDYCRFMTRYYERCLKEDPRGEWADSRYSAGWGLVNWFVSLWNDKAVPRSAISDLKTWLAGIYKDADADLRLCVETATLEHLFEHKDIRKYFADWEGDPILGSAFTGAMGWVQGGGKTPLGKPEWFRKAKGGGPAT
jgi:hypothetical protein